MFAFSSFKREYLDPVVEADQCAQYVDDIGIAANNATDLTRNIRAVFQCIRNTGLKLTNEKFQNLLIRGSIATNSQDSKFPE